MKISIDTDVDTFDSSLKAIHAAYGETLPATGSKGSATGTDEEDDDYLPGHWTRPRLRKLVEWLGESDAAVTVRYIAEHAPAVSLDDVFKHMSEHTGIEGFDGKDQGGRMSAVGFACKSIGGGVGRIYETDYNARKYRMDKKLAAAILDEMEAFDND
jgi:hypothetical protein